MTIVLQLLGVLIIGGLIAASQITLKKNPKLKTFWVFIGFLMFITGMLSLVVNSVGITFGFLNWVEQMGKLGSFLFKLGLIFGGVAVVVLVSHDEEAYDEYFDGNKYQ
jgi:hypothetical protein